VIVTVRRLGRPTLLVRAVDGILGTYNRTRALVFPCETEITNNLFRSRARRPAHAGNEKDVAKQTADGLLLYRLDPLDTWRSRTGKSSVSAATGSRKLPRLARSRPGSLSYSDHLSGPDGIASSHTREP
jgi:hypothetical protein